jgi:hypothetical protein
LSAEAARGLGWQAVHGTQPERLGAQLQTLLPHLFSLCPPTPCGSLLG